MGSTNSFLSYLVERSPLEGGRLSGANSSYDSVIARRDEIINRVQSFQIACAEATARHYSDLDGVIDVLNLVDDPDNVLNTASLNILSAHLENISSSVYPWWIAGSWVLYRGQNLLTNMYNTASRAVINGNTASLPWIGGLDEPYSPAHLPGFNTSSAIPPIDDFYKQLGIFGTLNPINADLTTTSIPLPDGPFVLSPEFHLSVITGDEIVNINGVLGVYINGDLYPGPPIGVSADILRQTAWDIGLGTWAIMAPINGRIEAVEDIGGADELIIDPNYMNDPDFRTESPQGFGVNCDRRSSPYVSGALAETEAYFSSMLNDRKIKIYDPDVVGVTYTYTLDAGPSFTIVNGKVRILLNGFLGPLVKSQIETNPNALAFTCHYNDGSGIYDFTHGWSTVFAWNNYRKSDTTGDWVNFTVPREYVSLDGSNLFANARSFFKIDGEYRDGRDLMYHLNMNDDTMRCTSLSSAIKCQGIYSGMIREVSDPNFGTIEEYNSLEQAAEMLSLKKYAADNEQYYKKESELKLNVGSSIFNYIDEYVRLFRTSMSSLESYTPIGSEEYLPRHSNAVGIRLLTGHVEVACPEKYGGVSLLNSEFIEEQVPPEDPESFRYAYHISESASKYDGKQYPGFHSAYIYPSTLAFPGDGYVLDPDGARDPISYETAIWGTQNATGGTEYFRAKWDELAGGIGEYNTAGSTQYWANKFVCSWWSSSDTASLWRSTPGTYKNPAFPQQLALNQISEALKTSYSAMVGYRGFNVETKNELWAYPHDFDLPTLPKGDSTHKFVSRAADFIEELCTTESVSNSGRIYGIFLENEPDIEFKELYTNITSSGDQWAKQKSYATFSAYMYASISAEVHARQAADVDGLWLTALGGGSTIPVPKFGGLQVSSWNQLYHMLPFVYDAYENIGFQPEFESLHDYWFDPVTFDVFKPHERVHKVQAFKSDGVTPRVGITSTSVWCSEWAIDFKRQANPDAKDRPWVSDKRAGVYFSAMNTALVNNKVHGTFFRTNELLGKSTEDAYLLMAEALQHKVVPVDRTGYGTCNILITESLDGSERYILINNSIPNFQVADKGINNFMGNYMVFRYEGAAIEFFEWLGAVSPCDTCDREEGLTRFAHIVRARNVENGLDPYGLSWDDAPSGFGLTEALDVQDKYWEIQTLMDGPCDLYIGLGGKSRVIGDPKTISFYDLNYAASDIKQWDEGISIRIERHTTVLLKVQMFN